MRRASAAVVLVLGLPGCGLLDEPAGPSPTVVHTTEATKTAAPTEKAAVIPDALTSAVWTRATATMEVDLKILPDGRYRSVEIYSPVESGGIYQLQRVEDGQAQVSGDRLRLVGRTATEKRTAEDDPGGNYERPSGTRTGTYDWRVDGDRLHLTDANGDAAVFTRTTA
ncbi:hypothetical protein [Actinoplanes sp. NPDC051859]|uniref:hypothetical protein n=1 Tax=Actinoplanes sp. NPDC051859 TaxID=3363909 RepID=UPI0037B9A127